MTKKPYSVPEVKILGSVNKKTQTTHGGTTSDNPGNDTNKYS